MQYCCSKLQKGGLLHKKNRQKKRIFLQTRLCTDPDVNTMKDKNGSNKDAIVIYGNSVMVTMHDFFMCSIPTNVGTSWQEMVNNCTQEKKNIGDESLRCQFCATPSSAKAWNMPVCDKFTMTGKVLEGDTLAVGFCCVYQTHLHKRMESYVG